MGIPGKTVTERVSILLATAFGTTFVVPFAPGTFGSWPGILVAMVMCGLSWPVQIVLCAVFAIAAIPVCHVANRILGGHDDGRISADEWMLYPIAVIGLPLLSHWWLLPVTFLVIRICDIIKPPPARYFDRTVKGGFGIVIDDFTSQLYALGINWLIFWICVKGLR